MKFVVYGLIVVLAIELTVDIFFPDIHQSLPGPWGAFLHGGILAAAVSLGQYLLVVRPGQMAHERRIAELSQSMSPAY